MTMLTSLALIFLVGMSLGWLVTRLRLPSLLGMLLTGILLGPYVLNLLDDSILGISADLRQLALIIILTRAGLSLNIEDLKKVGITENDCVIGIAASGRTPYTIAALRYANEMGALSVSISCNRDSAMSKVAQISIAPVVGPEVISGSTRMKAGTAQKMIVNMLSTGVMVRIGKVYQNYMVHVQPTNKKLVARACNMITQLTNVDLETAQKYLKECDMKVATAIVMILAACSKEQANQALAQCQGHVRKAIESLTK